MIHGIEKFYQEIAESMIETIPEEWSTARFEAIFFPDSSIYEAEYTRKLDDVLRGFEPASYGHRAFRQLRQLFKDEGKRVWGRACFELQPNGEFNVSWGYDDCDENGNTIFDEEQELQRREARRRRLTEQ